MKFYEVFLGLDCDGRNVGKTCLQLRAKSPFTAAMEAERIINNRYGDGIIGHCLKVSPITEYEFLYCLAA